MYKKLLIVCVACLVFLLAAGTGFAADTGTCTVPEDMSLVIVSANWEFDIENGTVNGKVVVKNISDRDLTAPGVIVSFYDVEGKQLSQVPLRGPKAKLKPGSTSTVDIKVKLKELPQTIMMAPFEGLWST
ncbi:hypothetical protein [Thermovirga lienii]|uniref:hypothetical protein n=1 Tax=Thermovirga lienii TaxID=336261 RepID=UPI002FE2474A